MLENTTWACSQQCSQEKSCEERENEELSGNARCSHSVREKEKWLTKNLRKSLIISVDQTGLEPVTSRLWVSQSDIPWDFVICNHSWLSVLYKIIIFFESQKIPLTEIVCLRIVYAKIWHDSTRPLVSRFNFTRLMQTHFTSMKCQIGISKCVQSRPSSFIISQTTQISETAMLFLM